MPNNKLFSWRVYGYWMWFLNQRGRLLAPLLWLSILFIILGLISDTKTWLDRAIPVLAIATVLQLDSAGWFQRVMKKYRNADIIPSRYARLIVDDPFNPWQTAYRNYLYHDSRTGYWLGIIALLLQVWSSWLK